MNQPRCLLCTVTAVHDGYALVRSVSRAPLGGRLLSACMLASLQGKDVKVQPPYAFKRVQGAQGQWEVGFCLLPVVSFGHSYERLHLCAEQDRNKIAPAVPVHGNVSGL